MAIHVNVWQKPLEYCKVISLWFVWFLWLFDQHRSLWSEHLVLLHPVAYCNNCFYLFSDSKALSPRLYHSESSEVKWSEVAQSCPTLCDPVVCSPPGSSIHGILQARRLEWVAISFSTGSSQHRDQTKVSHIEVRRFTLWASREATYLNKGNLYWNFLTPW